MKFRRLIVSLKLSLERLLQFQRKRLKDILNRNSCNSKVLLSRNFLRIYAILYLTIYLLNKTFSLTSIYSFLNSFYDFFITLYSSMLFSICHREPMRAFNELKMMED